MKEVVFLNFQMKYAFAKAIFLMKPTNTNLQKQTHSYLKDSKVESSQ